MRKRTKLSKYQAELYQFLQDNSDTVCLWDSADTSLPDALAARNLVTVQRINNRALLKVNSLLRVAGQVYVADRCSYSDKRTIVWWQDEIVALVVGRRKPRAITYADMTDAVPPILDRRGRLK